MKKALLDFLLLLPLVLFLYSCGQDQEVKVPEKIKLSFEESHPEVKDVEWSLKEDSYEVNFVGNNIEGEAEYNLQGQITEEEIIINEKDLPENILQYLKKNHPQLHIGEASIEEKGGEKVYELELLNGFFREIELEFDIDGKFLSKESFKE